ncbi:bifunctional tetrahydrofolate synthase/dihydrofolate synthase [Buchnera aphidicola]|uniref:bifunctional tetrahydrofolate synthase/dihydrofolate synthase n=1 Tax=Buchnera aphidicola TaxID=9 RepID=UPI003463E7BF
MKNDDLNESKVMLWWLNYINKKNSNPINFSLKNVILVAEKLNILKTSAYVITITGTNGKGSTAYFLENLFLKAGYRTGLYTSPHLLNYYERIRINGKCITQSSFHIHYFKKVEFNQIKDPLTSFEFITLSALLIFKKMNIDIMILEVGIGGRLDATNIISPNISIITNIDFDHQNILGNTRDEIGYEKSGIFRHGIHVIIGDKNIPYSVYQRANTLQVYLHRLGYEWNWVKYQSSWDFYDKYGILNNLSIPKISLCNASIALVALRISGFSITKNIIKESVKGFFLEGRFHTVYNTPRVILDVAHNPHSANYLNKKLKQLSLRSKKNHNFYGIIGMLKRKDIKNTILMMSRIINVWHYAPLKNSICFSENILKKYLPKDSIFSTSIRSILYYLIHTIKKTDIIVVFGSFFTVSEALFFMKNIFYH